MAAVAAGAASVGGLVIGVRPDVDRSRICEGLSGVLYTGMGSARNAILVSSADAVIIVGGAWGTLSELALANGHGDIAVVSLGGWKVVDGQGRAVGGAIEVESPEGAVAAALVMARERWRNPPFPSLSGTAAES